MTEIAIDLIRTDGGTQPRAELDLSHVEELIEVLREGRTFKDPVTVFYDGLQYWLADGFHRYHATKQYGLRTIEADVRQGIQDDAIAFSCGANATHGLRRTKGDIKRAIIRLITLPAWKDRKQKEIAKQCGASESFVSEILKDLRSEEFAVNPPVEPDGASLECVTLRTPNEVVSQFFVDFPQLQALSNREIARRCGTTEGTVRNYRKGLLAEQITQETANMQNDATETAERAGPELSQEPAVDSAEVVTEELRSETFEPEPEEPDIQQDAVPEPPIDEALRDATPEHVQMPDQLQEEQEQEEVNTPSLSIIPPSEEVLRERERRRAEIIERNERLRTNGVELPPDQYSCLVVDPPWQMQKIEREERPNQFEFDYPTMTEEELFNLPLSEKTGDDCHLYLWTTQKHLPLALRIAGHWGFKYQCLMTWVKDVGFTPFSWMYSTEHVLFCTKGSLPLLAIGRRLDFSAKVREHSRKPDEFYKIVREVSPGPRLDVFSREKRDGFEQYGNEVEKFVV